MYFSSPDDELHIPLQQLHLRQLGGELHKTRAICHGDGDGLQPTVAAVARLHLVAADRGHCDQGPSRCVTKSVK